MQQGAAQAAGAPRLVTLFRRMVTTEFLLGAGALLAAGLLTSQAPARAPTSPASLLVRGAVADLRVALEISPGRVGLNTFTVTLTSGGQPVVGAKGVDLRFDATDFDIPQSTATLQEVGAGRYSTQGAYLSLPDRWRVQVAVRRAEHLRCPDVSDREPEAAGSGAEPAMDARHRRLAGRRRSFGVGGHPP